MQPNGNIHLLRGGWKESRKWVGGVKEVGGWSQGGGWVESKRWVGGVKEVGGWSQRGGWVESRRWVGGVKEVGVCFDTTVVSQQRHQAGAHSSS